MTKLELTINDFYAETLNEIVQQFNELVPAHASYSYSVQDVIELLIIKEYVNYETIIRRP
ncbi:hypothetical protein [Psychrobacillus lasiicapitis]|uniref:Uncharacterized protein n=1 Tax=Psychrobacillus lasiicapitis TaxID=1636719 RepID=A0A544THB5_9BACI|nr:hypothetical protein [Psychrobacillus lasiicapitis]TQR16824.1 hypothetical protein FG382_01310 [Psychrobacillus lasiicapitis]GGA26855.1 hypothetical protein GCM10011384_15220 [Psychrobacillus lasiicapitis]